MFGKREAPLTDRDLRAIIAGLQYENQMLKKNTDGEPWYNRFDQYFEGEELQHTLKYDPRLKRWFRYGAGVFHEMEESDIDQIIFEWGDFTQEKLSPSRVSLLRSRIRAAVSFMGQWDPDPNVDNCLNGLVYKVERELHEHTWDYPSRNQITRHFTPDVEVEIPDLFVEMLKIITSETERAFFIQFCINVVHNFFEEEIFCIVYGPRNGGKSTVLRIFELIFGRHNVSKTKLHGIGKRFGLSQIYYRKVNVNPDLPIVPLTDETISTLKQLTGNDGMIEVELKGRDLFTYFIQCFLVFGINQLPGFKSSSEKEIESIFRRVLLISIPETQKKNPAFKKSTEDPKFLDQLYSWLVCRRPLPIIEDIDIWVNSQQEKWLMNANPILAILKQKYSYSKGRVIACREVYEYVLHELENDGILTTQQLQTNVTQALQTMKIYKNAQRGANAKYENIKEVI